MRTREFYIWENGMKKQCRVMLKGIVKKSFRSIIWWTSYGRKGDRNKEGEKTKMEGTMANVDYDCKVHKIDGLNAIKQWETILNLNALMERWDDLIDFVGLCCCSLVHFLQLVYFCAFFAYLWYNFIFFFSFDCCCIRVKSHIIKHVHIDKHFPIFFLFLNQ